MMITSHKSDVVGIGDSARTARSHAADESLNGAVVRPETIGESGHIACHNGEKPRTCLFESASKPQIASEFASISAEYDHFEILQEGTVLDIPSMELAVINRLELGRLLIRGVESTDAEFHYDMMV